MSETNKLIKCSFAWTEVLKDVESPYVTYTTNTPQIRSPYFISNISGEAFKWQLTARYYIQPSNADLPFGRFGVKLNCLTEYSPEREVAFTIHLIKRGNIVKTHKHRLNSNHYFRGNKRSSHECNSDKEFYGFNRSDCDRNGHLVVKDFSLKIICDIIFEVPTVCIIDNCSTTSSTDHGLNKFDNLKNFFDSDKLSDVKIVAGGEEFRAHKLILSLRSKVFAAMFSHDMQEKAESVVRIEDVDADVMREMLRFVYVDKIQEKDKLTGDLLAVAEKYEIDDLKDWCEQELMKAVNLDNFHSIFALADLHRAQKLKKHLVEFLAKKTEECSKI